MKLTRVQRLFVAIGHVDKEIIRYSCMLKEKPWRQLQTNHPAYNFKKRYLQGLRARRKQLIRAARRAYELEIGDAFTAGYEMCKRDHNISDEYMLVDGDIIF